MKLPKQLIATNLALSILTSTALAAVPSFSDIGNVGWAEAGIKKAVEQGLFQGTSTPVDGVGTFSPEMPMTRAMFLVVVSRALGLPTEAVEDADWAEGGINSLIEQDVIEARDFSDDYNKPMTREEMAYVLGNALAYTGETLNTNIAEKRIPDYLDTNYNYQDEVLVAYSNGLLTGTDDNGTFDPKGTLNRAQAATVLVRLVDKDSRQVPLPDAEDYVAKKKESLSLVQTISQSKNSFRTPAKVGDIYIKADGTKVTLVRDSNGVLKGSDGSFVAADLGMKSKVDTVRRGDAFNFEIELNGKGVYEDYHGNSLQNQTYWVLANGMGIWSEELKTLRETIKAPTYSGTDGEVSPDEYGLYIWYDMFGCWMSNR